MRDNRHGRRDAGTLDANTTLTARVGTLTVAGLTFTVNQAAMACTYSISPTSASFVRNGGSATVAVFTSAGCSWTAASSASWIRVSSGASGSGNGTVGYIVQKYTGKSPRTGTILIVGRTFTVTQTR
jgi:hypothetical protein